MKFTSFTLIALMLITAQVYSASTCPANCASCGLKDGSTDQFCFVCGYGMEWKNGACDTKFSDVNCTFHSAAGCLGCAKGWYLNMDTQKCDQPTPITGCYAGGHNPSGIKQINGPMKYNDLMPEDQKFFQAPTVTCNVCEGFYPSADFTQCNSPLIPGDNCKWGALDDYGKHHCMMCNSGYVSNAGTCKISFSAGCMYSNTNGQCVQCNKGYFMKYAGVCAINTGSVETQLM